MTCFCKLEHPVQLLMILLTWLGCLAEIVLLVYRTSHRRAGWRTAAGGALLCGLLLLLCFMIRCNQRTLIIRVHLPVPVLAAVIVGTFLCVGISLTSECRRSKREIDEWSVKEAIDDLPVGLCFADASGRIILCNRKMNVLSHQLTGRYPQTLDALTGALAECPERRGVVALEDVSDCYRFPDGRVYHFCSSELDGEELQGYTQLAAHDETELYDGNARLRENNAELEQVNRELQKMYERMADDVREKESLELKVWLHDTLGSSLLTVQDVKNSSSLEVKQKLSRLKEAVGMLSATRPTVRGTFEEAQQKAAQLGVKVTLNGYIPRDTPEESLIAAAVRECVTNCVRHAKGDAVFVRAFERAGVLIVAITNNGEPPKAQITEGSGLSSLRRSVEASGGEMHISHKPSFCLALHLPRKENAL